MAPASRLLLTAALLVAMLASAPVASADGAPRSFGIPALRQGDAWTYAVAEDGDGPRLLQHSFEQQGPSIAYTPQGISVATTRLVDVQTWMEQDEQVVHHWTYEVDATGATIAATHLRAGPGAGAINTFTGMPAGLPDIVESESEYPVVATTRSGPEPTCGHRSGLQGATVRLAPGVALHGCPGSGRFVPLAERDFGGQTAVVLGLAEDPDLFQVWVTADRPVPVRIVDFRGPTPVVRELVAFTPGQDALAYGTPGPDLPVIETAPRTPHGLSEAGVDHPFPLAVAYAAAVADADFGGFLERPGAYLQAAEHSDLLVNQHGYQERQRSWLLVASDGASASAIRVTQASLETAQQSPVPLAAPPQAPTLSSADAGGGPWPAASLAPADFPTVASLLRRWASVTAEAGAANAWGFRITCADDACAAASMEAWAGRDQRTQPNEPSIGFASATIEHRDADLVAADQDGLAAWSEQVDFRREYSLAGVPILATGEPYQPVAIAPTSPGAAERVPWTGIAAAGAAVGLAAALVWLVKAGPLAGLFSRHIADVTAHPVRRAVLDAIRAQPGIHHSELLRHVGKGNSVVTNHLRRLAGAGLVVERQGPRYRCYFPADATRASLAAGPLVKSSVAHGILLAVAREPASGQDLAQRLGVEPGAITYHVQRLHEAGLLATRRQGRFVLVEATESGRQAAAADLR